MKYNIVTRSRQKNSRFGLDFISEPISEDTEILTKFNKPLVSDQDGNFGIPSNNDWKIIGDILECDKITYITLEEIQILQSKNVGVITRLRKLSHVLQFQEKLNKVYNDLK